MNCRHHVSLQNHHHKKKKKQVFPTLALPSVILWKKRSSPTRSYLFVYLLRLYEAPHLLNFAIAELPSDVFREACHDQGEATDDDKDEDFRSRNNNYSNTSATSLATTRAMHTSNLERLWLHSITLSPRKWSRIESQQFHVASETCRKSSLSTRVDQKKQGHGWMLWRRARQQRMLILTTPT